MLPETSIGPLISAGPIDAQLIQTTQEETETTTQTATMKKQFLGHEG